MKKCPKCQDAPAWHFASHTTRGRKDGNDYFLFTGCIHAREFSKEWRAVQRTERPPLEDKWNAEAVRLFDVMTERWTEPQRTAFRLRLRHLSHEPELLQEEEPAPTPPEVLEDF